MAVISIKKIKKMKEEAKQVKLVDIAEFIPDYDLVLPFRIKSLDEQNRILSTLTMDKKFRGVKEFTHFRNAPKELKEFYQSNELVNGTDDGKIYFVVVNPDLDEELMREKTILTRIMNIVMHIDMDTKFEDEENEGKLITLWKAFGIKQQDYVALARAFYEAFLTSEEIIEKLEWIIVALKQKKDVKEVYKAFDMLSQFSRLPEETQQEYIRQMQAMKDGKDLMEVPEEAEEE